MRASLLGKDNLEFANYLLKIGEGEEGEELDGETWIPIRPVLQSKSNTIHEFCSEIFPRLKEKVESGLKNRLVHDDTEWIDWLVSRAVIVPTNDDAQEVNDILMKKLSGEEMVYKSADSLLNKKKNQGGLRIQKSLMS